jgi:hypothetical protein
MLAASACGSTSKAAVAREPSHQTTIGTTMTALPIAIGHVPLAAPSMAKFRCTTAWPSTVVHGHPDIKSVPPIRSVGLTPLRHGLIVDYRFESGFPLAPPGVLLSWTVYLYRHRSDAAKPTTTVELQIEDRGQGWEPSGWTLLASTYYNSTPVEGTVHMDRAGDDLMAFFPAGFTDLDPPFYWYASQEADRLSGSVLVDCPQRAGDGPYGLPDANKLLAAPG